jgi:hypothetical protein
LDRRLEDVERRKILPLLGFWRQSLINIFRKALTG